MRGTLEDLFSITRDGQAQSLNHSIVKSLNGKMRVTVRNLQRTIAVNVADLEKFAKRAVCCCIKIRRKKQTELMRLGDIFVWLISDRRMSRLHREFLSQTGPTDVLTFHHGEIFISVELATRSCASFSCTSSMAFYTCTDSTITRQPRRAKWKKYRKRFLTVRDRGSRIFPADGRGAKHQVPTSELQRTSK